MNKKILVVTSKNKHIKPLTEDLSRLFVVEEVDSYLHAIEYLQSEFASTELVIVSKDIFCENAYSMVSEMNKNILFKSIPIICIADTQLSAAEQKITEIEVLEHGAIDFFALPLDIDVIRCHINQLLLYRVSLACAQTVALNPMYADKRNGIPDISKDLPKPQHFDSKYRLVLIEQLRIIMQQFSEGITISHVINNKLKHIYANKNFYSLIGYTENEFESDLSGDLTKRILPEYLPLIENFIASDTLKSDVQPIEYQFRKKDGSLIWVRVRTAVCYFYSASVPVYICIYEDITLAKKTELRIKSINEKLGNSEIFIQFEVTKRVLESFYSKYEPSKTIDTAGKSDEYIQDSLLESVYEEDRQMLIDALSLPALTAYYQSGEPKFTVEYRRHMSSGEIRWFCAICILLEGITAGTITALIYCHDIDEKVKKRLATRKAIDTNIDAITTINIATDSVQVMQIHDGSVVNLGKAKYESNTRNYIEHEVAEEDKLRCTDLFSLKKVIARVSQDGFYDFSYWTVLSDSSNRRKNVRFIYLDDIHDDLLMIIKDITELFQQEQIQQLALRHNAELANAANLAKSNFLSNMSHDMRTPINAILGLASLAKQNEQALDMAELIKSIEASGQYLLDLVNDTLDLSKIESGNLEFHQEPYQLDEFIFSLNTVIKPLMDAKNIDFVINLKHDIECIVVDKLRFTQIIFNLLSNAAKYTPYGGRVEISSEEIPPKDGKVGMRFYIRDNGIGMSHDYQNVLFERYSQEDRPFHSELRGTGLGMSIVKQIVDLSGGHIEVESEINQGTTFIVDLYAYSVSHPQQEVRPKASFDKLKGVHILLVDDMEVNSMITKKILETKGCLVDAVFNGEEALHLFTTSAPGYYDIIFTDVRMPIMDGLELTRRIRSLTREDSKSIPIIGATADAYTKNQDLTLLSGMNARLIKPIMPEKLYECILTLLEEKEAAFSYRS